MRISVVHSYYSSRRPSGENVVVDDQVAALRRAGHDVDLLALHTDDLLESRWHRVRAAKRVATGRGPNPADAIARFLPDVVHVHNLFPNFGRTWVRSVDVPVVATLHNYRPMCAVAILFRDGHACSECPDSASALPAVRHGCYKGSRLASLPMAAGTRFANDPLLAHSARIVTLNDHQRARYAAIGVPEQRMVTVPNFVLAGKDRGPHDGDYWIFVGRLSPEKGIGDLVSRWPADRRLLVVGEGELADDLAAAARPGVELLGQRPAREVRALMEDAVGLVFPSTWPEGLPMVYLEALAAGLPVLAWPQSVVGDLVRAEGTGLVAGDSLTGDLAAAEERFPGLVDHCREVYESRYTEKVWVSAIEGVYREAIGASRRAGAGAANKVRGVPDAADSHAAAVVAAQDVGHEAGHDYDKGSPHLRHDGVRKMVESRLTRLVGSHLETSAGCRVLEIGGGHGTFTRCLLDAGAAVTVTEASRASASRLERSFGDSDQVEVVYDSSGDGILASDRQWDMAVMTAVLHHIPDYISFLEQLLPLLATGGSLFTAADPLYYPRIPGGAHFADRGAYLAWRLVQGNYARGLATRIRRLRGVYDDTRESDLVEYHVVREGVDEEAISELLEPHFGDVEIFRYWASQAPIFQWLGERTSMLTDFGIEATRRRNPQAEPDQPPGRSVRSQARAST